MLKFIGAQVYQHQDDVVVEMGLPISTPQTPIDPPTSNLNIVENDGLLELVTDPDSTIRIQRGESGWSFTANERGRTNISQLENGVYLVSVNNSEPESVVLAKGEDYDWMNYRYYTPEDYIIHIDGERLPGYSDKWVVLYDAEGNEVYRTIMDKNTYHVDITYTMEDSPGLLEPGQYRMTVESWVQDFTLELSNSPDILSFWYNNYLSYNIKIGAPHGSQVHLQGHVTYTYDVDESFDVSAVSDGWGPSLPEGSYTVFYVFNGMTSDLVNLDLVGRPFQDVKLDKLWYYNENSYTIYLSGEPSSRVVVDGVENPYPISADGLIEVNSSHLNHKLYPEEVYDIYTYNRDWTSNTIQIVTPIFVEEEE